MANYFAEKYVKKLKLSRVPSELHTLFPTFSTTRLQSNWLARWTRNALIQKESHNKGKEIQKLSGLLFSHSSFVQVSVPTYPLYMTLNSVHFWWTLNHVLKKSLKNLKFYFTTSAIKHLEHFIGSKQIST